GLPMTSADPETEPRTLHRRRDAALERLQTHHQLWLATGGDSRGAHLIPVAYTWNGRVLTTATFERSRTTANIRANPHARVAIGETASPMMLDVHAPLIAVSDMDSASADNCARVSNDPRTVPGFVYLRLVPQRIQVWNGFHE